MASILNVDTINNAAGTSAIGINSSSGLVTFPNSVTIPDGATMPAGSAVQVTALQDTTEGASTSTSYAECSSNYRPAITPSSTSNKILASFEMNIWADVDNDSQGTVAAQIKIEMYVNGVLDSTIYESATNNLARGGQNRFTTINVTRLTTPATTNEVTFRTSFRRNSGSRTVKFNTGSYSRAVLTEIAG